MTSRLRLRRTRSGKGSDDFGIPIHGRRHGKWFRRTVYALLGAYAVVTLFPFYFLFIRTFVTTSQATELYLTIPPSVPLDFDATLGGLAVFYNLDLSEVKEDLGLPPVYLSPRMTLRELADEYDLSDDEIRQAFNVVGRFNGWQVLFNSGFWGALIRTLVITVGGVLLLNFLSVMTGFGLAGLERKDQRLWFFLYLLRAIVPPMLVILPQFLLVQRFIFSLPGYSDPGIVREGLQLLVVILIWAKGGALPVLIMTSGVSAIPRELEDSAHVDGATPFQYFRYVVLPLMRVPMIALTVIFVPIVYNDFLNPFVYLDQSNTTVLPLIQSFTGQFSSNFQVLYTGTFISVLPLALLYFLFRRWFTYGMLGGAVKG